VVAPVDLNSASPDLRQGCYNKATDAWFGIMQNRFRPARASGVADVTHQGPGLQQFLVRSERPQLCYPTLKLLAFFNFIRLMYHNSYPDLYPKILVNRTSESVTPSFSYVSAT
jgi:hypothetical protein